MLETKYISPQKLGKTRIQPSPSIHMQKLTCTRHKKNKIK